MLAVTTWILAAGALAEAQTVPTAYSYSYTTEGPTMTPTASLAPTRTETYAPSRVTEAPSSLPAAPDIVLPQGGDGNDVLNVAGERVYVDVCPASALPTAPNLVFFRRAATTLTRARSAASSPPWRTASPFKAPNSLLMFPP